jgi:hypothetical protein
MCWKEVWSYKVAYTFCLCVKKRSFIEEEQCGKGDSIRVKLQGKRLELKLMLGCIWYAKKYKTE